MITSRLFLEKEYNDFGYSIFNFILIRILNKKNISHVEEIKRFAK